MNKRIKTTLLLLMMLFISITIFANGSQETELTGLAVVASGLGITENELKAALGDPSQGKPDFQIIAQKLGVDSERLEELMKSIEEPDPTEVEPYTISINGNDFEITNEVYTWSELPADVIYERQPILTFTNNDGVTHYYEVIYLEEGNLNWYQTAYLAQDAGGYLSCPTTEEENAFIFSQVNDEKFFWSFPEEGEHYGISIGPFLGGFQPDGSVEPAGGWTWLSGEEWDYSNWAKNIDDGVKDKDPRDNTQPNDSGDGQPIMGFGELNLPVSTWGDYMESIGTYGKTKLPGRSYGFIIEYESDPR